MNDSNEEFDEYEYEDDFLGDPICGICGFSYCPCCGCDCWMNNYDSEDDEEYKD